MELIGKKIVITGAGRGLGRAMAICFAKEGAELFLCARNVDKLEETQKLVEDNSGHKPFVYSVDLCKPEQIRAFADAVAAQSGHVDILVNNGANWLSGDLESASDEAISETIHSAAVGTTLMTRHFLPLLRNSREADIVNMISVCGVLNLQHEAAHEAYHAAKHAQAGFTDRLRHRMKSEGIRVIAVYPPDFDNVSPLSEEWKREREVKAGERISNRHVIEAIQFALTRDRICSVNSIHLDSWPSLSV